MYLHRCDKCYEEEEIQAGTDFNHEACCEGCGWSVCFNCLTMDCNGNRMCSDCYDEPEDKPVDNVGGND